MSTKERRQEPRAKSDLVLEVLDPQGTLVLAVGHLLDLSLVGARFESSTSLKRGDAVCAQLRFNRDSSVKLPSKVVWVGAKGRTTVYGIEFLSVSSDQRSVLDHWVKKGKLLGAEGKKVSKTTYTLGMLPGDGVGPECLREGIKAVNAATAKAGLRINWVNFDFGGARYLKTGEILPDSAFGDFRKLDAIYLGAIGHPDVKPGVLEQGLLLKLRFGLDQYINLRPVILYPGIWSPLKDKGPEQIDFVVVRENTEGGYVGMGGFFKKGTPDEVAQQIDINTRKGVERCIRYAFEYCRKRNKRKKLTMVDKANVLTYGHDLWTRAFAEVGKEYSDITQDHAFVDAACMWFVKNPEWFDVIVTNNMFGDILTDLGAMIQGGLGVAAGGEHQSPGCVHV